MDNTPLEELLLQPLSLDEIPEILQGFIYNEERKRGEVFCTKTAYMIVLLLRWALSGPEWGPDEYFEGKKVFWQTQDKHGFRTKIILWTDYVRQYDLDFQEMRVVQEQAWVELGELYCGMGKGHIERVYLEGCCPYGKLELRGENGVRRMVEDAMAASHHTHYRFETWDDGRTYGSREDDYGATLRRLSFAINYDHPLTRTVTSIDVRAEEDPYELH